jgi:3-phosphoglycerate kinase
VSVLESRAPGGRRDRRRQVSTKIEVLTNLAAKVDKLIIGGIWPNVLPGRGVEIGKSLARPRQDRARIACRQAAPAVILPHDFGPPAQRRPRAWW